MVGVTVDGGMCRRPGPSLSGMEGFVDVGRRSEGISSPGNTRCIVILIGFGRVVGIIDPLVHFVRMMMISPTYLEFRISR